MFSPPVEQNTFQGHVVIVYYLLTLIDFTLKLATRQLHTEAALVMRFIIAPEAAVYDFSILYWLILVQKQLC